MNKRHALHSILFVLFLSLMGGATAQQSYTLDQLIGIGLEESENIKMVQEELHKTDAQIMEAKGGAMPNISASANYSYGLSSNPTASSLENEFSFLGVMDGIYGDTAGRTETPDETAIRIIASGIDGMFDGFTQNENQQALSLSLRLEQPIYAQGKVGIGLKIAKTYKQTLFCKLQASKQEVIAQITQLYYGCLLAKNNKKIKADALQIAQQSHDLAKKRLSLGEGAVLDTLSTRLKLEVAKNDLDSANANIISANATLLQVCNLDLRPSEFILSGDFPDEFPEFDYTECKETLLKENKTLGQLQGNEDVQELLVKLNLRDYHPMVYCGASLGKLLIAREGETLEWHPQDRYGQNERTLFIGASLTLFDGFKRQQKIKQARSELKNFQLTQKQTREMLLVSLRDNYEMMELNRRKLRSSHTMVALAQQGYTMASRSYETGALSLLELQQKEIDLYNAKLALNAARFALHSSITNLQILMGTLPIPVSYQQQQ